MTTWNNNPVEDTERRRLGELIAEMRTMLGPLPADGDLTGAQDARYTALTDEFDALASKLGLRTFGTSPGRRLAPVRGRLDELDREMSKPRDGYEPTRLETHNDGDYRRLDDGARILTRSQKLADLPEVRNAPGSDLSLIRWLRAKVTGDWSGIDPEVRTGSVGSDTLGGYLVPTPISSRLIDMARSQAVVMKLGALTVPMDSATLDIASLDADVTAGWKLENVAGTFSDASFGKRTLHAQTVAAFSKMSVELAEDGQDPTGIIERSMASALALALDLAALRGSGVGAEPQGILGWGNGVTITELDANGRPPTIDDLIDAISDRRSANESPNGIAWHPRTGGYVAKLKDGDGNYQPLPKPASEMQIEESSQIPVNLTVGTSTAASEIYVGDWSNLIVGMRTGISLEVSRQAAQGDDSAFVDYQLWLRAIMRCDLVVARGTAFEVLTGVDAS